jgi:hypothetical protein
MDSKASAPTPIDKWVKVRKRKADALLEGVFLDEQSLLAQSAQKLGILALDDELLAQVFEFVFTDGVHTNALPLLSLVKFCNGRQDLSNTCKAFSRVVRLANPAGMNCFDMQRTFTDENGVLGKNYLKRREIFRWPKGTCISIPLLPLPMGPQSLYKLIVFNKEQVHVALVKMLEPLDSEYESAIGIELPKDRLVQLVSGHNRLWTVRKVCQSVCTLINPYMDALGRLQKSGLVSSTEICDDMTSVGIGNNGNGYVFHLHDCGTLSEKKLCTGIGGEEWLEHLAGKHDSVEAVARTGFIPVRDVKGLGGSKRAIQM